jgi:hypothetical protein
MYPREVTERSAEILDEADLDWIGSGQEDNRGGFGYRLCRKRRWGIKGDKHSHIAADQFARHR